MSGFLLLVTSINAEYEWNGDEWIWKEPGPKLANDDLEGSGNYGGEEDYSAYDDEDDEDYAEGSGDDRQYGTRVDAPPSQSNNNNNNRNNNNNNADNDFSNWQDGIQDRTTARTPYEEPYPDVVDRVPDMAGQDPVDNIIVDQTQNTFSPPTDNNNNLRNNDDDRSRTRSPTSFFAQPGTMAAVIGGAVVGLLCAILCVMFVVYRMRKKDEGSYALDEPKRSPTVNSYSKPPSREFYA